MIVFLVNEKRTRLTWDGNDSSEISFYNRGVFSTRELAEQSIERYTQQSRSFKFFSINTKLNILFILLYKMIFHLRQLMLQKKQILKQLKFNMAFIVSLFIAIG